MPTVSVTLTPWQMFAFGIIGFLAGILFRKGRIMSPPSMLPSWPSPKWGYTICRASLLISSTPLPYIAAESMLEKLDRMKVKYRLVE